MQTVTAPPPAASSSGSPRSLGLMLIKPSYYDEDGYVIQWWRALLSSNTQAVVNSLIQDAHDREVLGPGVRIETRIADENTEVLNFRKIKRWLNSFDRCAVFLVGVQSSQFPRSVDIGREFTDAGIPVVLGGFHISGATAMVPHWKPAFAGIEDARISVFTGELESGLDLLLTDIFHQRLQPNYNMLQKPADLGRAPPQRPLFELADRTIQKFHGIEVGRGCPFVCSFCTIINVHGHAMRNRTPDAIKGYVKACVEQGAHSFFLSDDNFSRSPVWREVLEALADLRKKMKATWEVVIQVDALATRVPGFVEACKAAGVTRVFVGLESVRPDNLKAAGKGQNKVHQLRDMMVTWKQAGVVLYAGVIVGMPNDTPERLAEDVRYMQDILPVDFPSIFLMTPLPGSADHQKMVAEGASLDEDLNTYDNAHSASDHPNMTRREVQDVFWRCYRQFYSWPHLTTILARGLLHGANMEELRSTYVSIRVLTDLERVHPLISGAIRIRDPRTRRAGFPRPWLIPHLIREVLRNTRVVSIIFAMLGYAYLLEQYLRWQMKRGGLEKYRLLLSSEGAGEAPVMGNETAAAAAVAAE